MTYQVNGRVTQAEETILRNSDRSKVTPKTKYKELKALFDKDGWSAFDKEQTALFDDLNEVFGEAAIDNGKHGSFQKTAFDIKPTVLAERDKDIAEAGDKSHEVFDKEAIDLTACRVSATGRHGPTMKSIRLATPSTHPRNRQCNAVNT